MSVSCIYRENKKSGEFSFSSRAPHEASISGTLPPNSAITDDATEGAFLVSACVH